MSEPTSSGPARIELADATVTIIGLGLLGGSIGMALDGQCARRIGVVRTGDVTAASAALERGAVDHVDELDRAVAAADLVIIATPVEAAVELLPRVAAHLAPGAVLTDVASTKRVVVEAMRVLDPPVLAYGGHPMRGGIDHGIDHARGDLTRGGAWALCEAHDPDGIARALLQQLLVAVNATPVWIDADAHDAIVAHTSHLPYVVAQAVAHAVRTEDDCGLAGAGLDGAVRMARGDVDMWSGVLRTNAEHVLRAIEHLRQQLDIATTRIAAGGPLGELDAWLDEGRVLALGDEAATPGTLPG